MCSVIFAVLIDLVLIFTVVSPDDSQCNLPYISAESYYQEGDLIIGGVLTIDTMARKEFQTLFEERPYGVNLKCLMPNIKNYQHILSFVYAIDEINRSPNLLPNLTLGFNIVDSCLEEIKALIGIFEIMSKRNVPIPNYNCKPLYKLVAIVEGIKSEVSFLLASMLGVYKTPQISYATLDPALSDKTKFPYFYRTVPNDISQYKAIVQLVKYFGWSWVGVLVSDNDSGIKISQFLQKELLKFGCCIAFLEFIPHYELMDNSQIKRIVEYLRISTVNVVIVYGDWSYIFSVHMVLETFPIKEKVWIMPSQWDAATGYDYSFLKCQPFGSLAFTIKSHLISGFENFVSQIHKALKRVHFLNSAGDEVHFDSKGDMYEAFDIINWIYYPNKTLDGVKVGRYDERNSTQSLIIDPSLIRWNPAFNQTPNSACSKMCLPGFRKSTREEKFACCYDCIPCPEGEISNQTDAEVCHKCPNDQWPNFRKDECLFKVISYLSYNEPLGKILTATSMSLFIINCIFTAFFTKYKDTAVMKANNQTLSYILLISLKVSFLCIFLFIGPPMELTCLLRQVIFGITFSISVSSILAKTLTVIVAFHATRPRSKLKSLLGPKVSFSLVCVCSLCQVLICALWLGISPPFPYYNMEDEVGRILAVCHEGSPVGFYCVLGYLGLLSSLSFIVAFLSRNLPDLFNEAKFITFSMLASCSVWISFVPAYLSTKGKYVVAVEIFAILTSTSGLLGCIFIPKCYFVIFRQDMSEEANLLGERFCSFVLTTGGRLSTRTPII
ncbi:vomeronasal type-2 receptor 26-like [Rhinoderma darwinii]|uniref:vomeronasal type-2 receptor 26-like n=1 Tax=Rhinoderma darwinii TaxID=43563 RepID=UPI003F676BB0